MTRKSVYGVPMQHNSNKKISDDHVRVIRSSTMSDRQLAKVYGVDKSTINGIKNGKMRRSVK